jgi:hypothetical protein
VGSGVGVVVEPVFVAQVYARKEVREEVAAEVEGQLLVKARLEDRASSVCNVLKGDRGSVAPEPPGSLP